MVAAVHPVQDGVQYYRTLQYSIQYKVVSLKYYIEPLRSVCRSCQQLDMRLHSQHWLKNGAVWAVDVTCTELKNMNRMVSALDFRTHPELRFSHGPSKPKATARGGRRCTVDDLWKGHLRGTSQILGAPKCTRRRYLPQ